ncbi:MAG TPA: hypothetical protein VJT73_05905 [Polyangiaceae bacterium]|nr:hypothetical protein [Polyangiaceae bacterium]
MNERVFRAALASLSLLGAGFVSACDTDGVTPVCPAEAGNCVQSAGDSSASVIMTTPAGAGGSTTAGAGGAGGASGSAGAGGSSGAANASGGGAGTVNDAGLLDVTLDITVQ